MDDVVYGASFDLKWMFLMFEVKKIKRSVPSNQDKTSIYGILVLTL